MATQEDTGDKTQKIVRILREAVISVLLPMGHKLKRGGPDDSQMEPCYEVLITKKPMGITVAPVPISSLDEYHEKNVPVFAYPGLFEEYKASKRQKPEIERLREELEAKTQECARLTEIIDQHKNDFQSNLDRSHKLNAENKTLSSHLEREKELEGKLKQSREEQKSANSELKEAKNKISGLQRTVDEERNAILAMRDENTSLRVKVDASNQLLQTVSALINPDNTQVLTALMLNFDAFSKAFGQMWQLMGQAAPDIVKTYANSHNQQTTHDQTDGVPNGMPMVDNNNMDAASFSQFDSMFYDSSFPNQ